MKNKEKIYFLIECAIFSAVLCICAPLYVPIGPVPVSLGTFAVMLASVVLGAKKGAVSVIVYIAIGLCGLPVFTSGRSGIAALAGPTGGYIWSYIIMAVIIGLICSVKTKNRVLSMLVAFLGCIVGVTVCYACGTWQYMMISDVSLAEALRICVIVFIPFDIAKAVVASVLGVCVKFSLIRAGFLTNK